jgi:hypothetical protein
MPGRKQFGHYPGELGIIARLQSLRAAGLGFDRIATRLNEEEIPSRSGKSWHGVVINRILSRTASRIGPRQGGVRQEVCARPPQGICGRV